MVPDSDGILMGMNTLDWASKLPADSVKPLPAVEVSLLGAVGCRLADSPRADTDIPAADVSMMDGYAVPAENAAPKIDARPQLGRIRDSNGALSPRPRAITHWAGASANCHVPTRHSSASIMVSTPRGD